ncbi:hypothetical protein N7492_000002 [Penicillium capsulatum]|uniref:Hydrophobin n=1 Tax=Penicillium capsulatum TaxID=69766 RepID=A0A9W9IV09_9EURO|nr:hypothetical protein N7492_000002 [Penicillium capsulatum]KAJ6130925.1 hypothetical protein N7512_003705 [Penicillium capsulatum]
MKASFVSVIAFAIAAAASALPASNSKPAHKPGPYDIVQLQEQCHEGVVSCCSAEQDIDDKSLLSLLNGFDLLGGRAVCSPVNVIGNINVAVLGSIDDVNGKVDCTHTVSCCNGKSCKPISM